MTTAIDEGSLTPDDARELRDRVARAGVFGLPERVPDRPGAADQFTYELTVEDGPRARTVVLSDENAAEDVRSLIAWIDRTPGHRQEFGSPMGSD